MELGLSGPVLRAGLVRREVSQSSRRKQVTNTHHRQRGWFKSSFSTGTCACVMVMFGLGMVLIRDSKYLRNPKNDPALQPTIEIPEQDWLAFLSEVTSDASTYSNGALTVEDAAGMKGLRSIADGKVLSYTAEEWGAFVAGAKAGEFLPVGTLLSVAADASLA
ncbi:MAG: DUF397 domain-containing protein [Acidimicrobiales bacterium]